MVKKKDGMGERGGAGARLILGVRNALLDRSGRTAKRGGEGKRGEQKARPETGCPRCSSAEGSGALAKGKKEMVEGAGGMGFSAAKS